jgi:hypothetical protein
MLVLLNLSSEPRTLPLAGGPAARLLLSTHAAAVPGRLAPDEGQILELHA